MIRGYPHFRKLPNSISSDCILAVFKFIIMLIIKCWRHFWDGSAPSFSITELFRTQEFLTFDQCLLLLSWPSCCAHRLTEGKKSSRKKAAKGSRMSFNWPARLLQSCAFLFLGFFLLEKCWVLLFRALVHPEWHLHRVWYSFWGCRLIWHLCWLVVVSHNFAYVHCFFLTYAIGLADAPLDQRICWVETCWNSPPVQTPSLQIVVYCCAPRKIKKWQVQLVLTCQKSGNPNVGRVQKSRLLSSPSAWLLISRDVDGERERESS